MDGGRTRIFTRAFSLEAVRVINDFSDVPSIALLQGNIGITICRGNIEHKRRFPFNKKCGKS